MPILDCIADIVVGGILMRIEHSILELLLILDQHPAESVSEKFTVSEMMVVEGFGVAIQHIRDLLPDKNRRLGRLEQGVFSFKFCVPNG